MPWILDLDGVVWRGDQAIEGSLDAIAVLRRRGERVLFLTNNSSLTVGGYLEKMRKLGLTCAPEDLCTAAQASAAMLTPADKVLVCGGPGIVEAVESAGATAVRDPEPGVTVVMVGWHKDFDFSRLTAAFTALSAGARLIGTNSDATYPTSDGELPGGGSIVAAVAYASGQTAVFGGKPFQPAADLALGRLGRSHADPESGSDIWMVGDRLSTDGEMAVRLRAKFGLVLTGVTKAQDAPYQPKPAHVSSDLSSLVREVI